jgi:hypothetical protein
MSGALGGAGLAPGGSGGRPPEDDRSRPAGLNSALNLRRVSKTPGRYFCQTASGAYFQWPLMRVSLLAGGVQLRRGRRITRNDCWIGIGFLLTFNEWGAILRLSDGRSSVMQDSSVSNGNAGNVTRIAVLCGQCNCGCPELLVDREAPPERRVVITDDFGQRVQMSEDQLRALIEEARSGRLDEALAGQLSR